MTKKSIWQLEPYLWLEYFVCLFVCLIWGLDWNLTCMKSCLVLTVDRQYSRRVLNSQKSLGICHRVCRKTLPKFRLQSSYRFLCYEQPIWKKQKSIKSHDNKKQAKTLTMQVHKSQYIFILEKYALSACIAELVETGFSVNTGHGIHINTILTRLL